MCLINLYTDGIEPALETAQTATWFNLAGYPINLIITKSCCDDKGIALIVG